MRELAVVKRLAVGSIETVALAARAQQVKGSCAVAGGHIEATVPR